MKALCIASLLVLYLLLCIWDVRYQRLPHWGTLPALGGAIVLAWVLQRPAAVWGGVLWSGLLLLMGVLSFRRKPPTARGAPGIGGGDIKLVASLGIVAALPGWASLLAAMWLAPLCSVVVMLMLQRKRIVHGPFLVAATTSSILAAAFTDFGAFMT